jgi:hypothetical protein
VLDNRMHWIRTVEEASRDPYTEVIEAELGSEARVTGELDYGDGAILLRPLTHTRGPDGLYKYFLRLQYSETQAQQEEWKAATAKGYLFPQGDVGEIAALCSLLLQGRFFLLSTAMRTRVEGGESKPSFMTEHSVGNDPVDNRTDSIVFGDLERNFVTDLRPTLDQLSLLPERYHLEVAVSAERYAQALRRVGRDEEMVFVLLVSAIERLSSEQTLVDDPLSDLDMESVIRTDDLSEEQVDELRSLFRNRKAKARFISFVQEYGSGFLDGEAREPTHTQVTPDNLDRVMGAIYDARSGYLHSGDPMYLSHSYAMHAGWHMDASVGQYRQNRRFSANQKLPHVEFFHRLVRYCILRRIDALTATT